MGFSYEDPGAVAEYLQFHYGSASEILSHPDAPHGALDFAVRAVCELLPAGRRRFSRALDAGCAVGRSSFELTRFADQVIGIDFSSAFIDAAQALQKQGSLPYRFVVEGKQTRAATALVPDGADPERVTFERGDAMNLRSNLGSFSLVFAANLICRLTDPRKFLQRLPGLVEPGGYLILCTPWTWLESFTPEDHWLGGKEGGGRSFDALVDFLDPDFELETTRDLPFLIREHERKFQWSVSQGARWKRRNIPS